MNMAGNGMQSDLFREAAPKKKPSKLPKLVAMLILAGIIGFYLFSGDEPSKIVAMPEASVPTTKSTVSPASSVIRLTSTSEPTPASKPPAVAISRVTQIPGGAARALIAEFKEKKGIADLQQIIKSAEKFKREAMLTDAYLLYFFAARQGDSAAALVLAKMNDPAYHSKQTSMMDQPDLVQAYKWYQQAARSGQAAAQKNLNDFRARMEQASAGNAEAKQLSLQWQ